MEQIETALFSRLAGKGVNPQQIPGLIRDVGNFVNENKNINAPMVSLRLAYLGWDEEMVDEYTFQLMLPVLDRMEKDIHISLRLRTV